VISVASSIALAIEIFFGSSMKEPEAFRRGERPFVNRARRRRQGGRQRILQNCAS
jgi:hypothetical protein